MGVSLCKHYLANRLTVFTSEKVGEIKGEREIQFPSGTFELLFLYYKGHEGKIFMYYLVS